LTYKEAITGLTSPNKEKWEEAISEEKNSLKENKTWKVINLKKLKEEKPLTGKWMFKVKQDGRYEQEQDINYEETSSD